MFAEYKKLDLSKLCSEVNVFWEKNKIFEKSISSRSEKNRFVFYEGPPSANGLPGIHHCCNDRLNRLLTCLLDDFGPSVRK